jgi:hypothetical protein
MVPTSGSVLGIDVGWSLKAKSSGICRLDWDEVSVSWSVQHFSGDPQARLDVVRHVAGGRQLLAAAFDGPLRGDLAIIDQYRTAERDLTRPALASRISQPGSSRSPVGRLLNHHTNELAALVLEHAKLGAATHRHAIHERALVEAFPTSFLGLMMQDPEKGMRQQRSDRYYEGLVANGTLNLLLAHHLPGRVLATPFNAITNHDDRAALVCALTALGIAGNDYLTVGDGDGWIILPPPEFIASWAQPLVANWSRGAA